MSEFEKYPMLMAHPHYRPAKVSAVEGTGRINANGEEVMQDMQGTPEQFPPVLVNNEDQEEYHASLGYAPAGKSDPSAYANAVADTPNNYVPVEFPKWVDGVLCETAEDEAEMRHAIAHRPPPEPEEDEVDVKALLEEIAALKAEAARRRGGRPRKVV